MTFAICRRASPPRSGRRGLPGADLDCRSDARPGAGGARACRPDHLRGRGADERRTDRRADLAPGVAAFEAADWDRCAGPGDPFVGHAFLSALEESGSARSRTGWQPVPIAIDGPDGRPDCGDAGLCEEPQPRRICVRPWLGRRVRASRRRLLSQAADRGAVHAGAGTAAAGARTPALAPALIAAAERVVAIARPLLGPRHLHRRQTRCPCSSARAG